MNKKRLIIIFVLLVGVLFGYFWYSSYQKVSIVYKAGVSGVKATIYATNTDNDEAPPEVFVNEANIVKTTDKDTSVKLKAGDYVFATEGKDYEPVIFKFEVSDSNRTIEVDPDHSKEKLASGLKQESGDIKNALSNQLGDSLSGYSVGQGELFKKSDWYGTIIYKSGTKESLRSKYRDIYRVVMHKENSTWTVVTLPPELSLSKNTYQVVPEDVLSATNEQEIVTN